jgi:hypothetical protein
MKTCSQRHPVDIWDKKSADDTTGDHMTTFIQGIMLEIEALVASKRHALTEEAMLF